MTLDVAAADLRRWREQPGLFVREMFDATPDAWQDEVLAAFPKSPRVAMKASKGPGKSTILAWLAWNFLATRPHPKCAATSVTGDNLADGLWSELAKWQQRSPWLTAQFKYEKTRISCRDHPETWFMSARTWPKSGTSSQQAETLAGLHADYILFILDESGSIPDAVMAAAEGALSSCIEGHIIQAGNPSHLEGPLHRACTRDRALWHVTEISGDPDDPMRSPRVSLEWARQQIQTYGRDNPWVLINVFGRFPPGSLNTLIGPDEVAEATRRLHRDHEYGHAARVLGVDVARFGDDSSIIFPRQGLQAFPPLQYRNLDSTTGAGAVARKWSDWEADACFVDDSGGYGAGWIDGLIQLGHTPIGVQFAGRAHNAARYENKRAEMAFDCVEWIKRGGALPDVPELAAALTTTTYGFRGDRMLLEPKDGIKERLGYSPDHFDALILTFAETVMPRARSQFTPRPRHEREWDPREALREREGLVA